MERFTWRSAGRLKAWMLHPATRNAAWYKALAVHEVKVRYHGTNAHASASPWDGVNALDAMVMAYAAISTMRQQLRPDDRVHGIITKGGQKPNIIPDLTEAEYRVRTRNAAELEVLKTRVMACFESAAIATGCLLEVEWSTRFTIDFRNIDAISQTWAGHLQSMGIRSTTKEEAANGSAGSTDMSNVSYLVPSLHGLFAIPGEPGGGNHTAQFTASAATPEAHEATLRAATAMALTAIDLYAKPELLSQAWERFRSS